MERTEAKKIVAMLATAFPVPAWTEDQYQLWTDRLESEDYERAKVSVMRIMDEREDRPAIATIIKAIRKLEAAASTGGSRLPTPQECWDEAFRAVMSIGWRRLEGHGDDEPEETKLHPLTVRAVDAYGGWQLLAALRPDEIGTARAQFRGVCESLAMRAAEDGATGLQPLAKQSETLTEIPVWARGLVEKVG